MGRDLQKRKNRSSRSVVRQPQRRMKALNPIGNTLIAQNWNKKETLIQNYRRFGLASKLGTAAGGADKSTASLIASSTSSWSSSKKPNLLTVPASIFHHQIGVVSEARIERDADGKIIRVIHAGKTNPLNDPLNRFDSNSDSEKPLPKQQQQRYEKEEAKNDQEEHGLLDSNKNNNNTHVDSSSSVIHQLELEANCPLEPRRRYQSERERNFLARLVRRHGADTAAMVRDRKLNPFQQARGDIEKRLRKAGMLQG